VRLSYLSSLNFHKAVIGILSLVCTCTVLASPVLNNVGAGSATVLQTPNSTLINQTSSKAILNWDSFNIGPNQSAHFQQPNGGIALNRIDPTSGVSAIYGRLTATGQIILINPAGIYFGASAFVHVGGIIASTANITDKDFLSGNYRFSAVTPYMGSVINEGQIIAANHGLIALLSQGVENNGRQRLYRQF
jgi:filamentous hemagglutinin family protein